jgi:hypothetical protein
MSHLFLEYFNRNVNIFLMRPWESAWESSGSGFVTFDLSGTIHPLKSKQGKG